MTDWRHLSDHHWRQENERWRLDYWPGSGAYALWPKHRSMRGADVIRGGDVEDGLMALRAASILPEGADSSVGVSDRGTPEYFFFHKEESVGPIDDDDDIIDYGDAF